MTNIDRTETSTIALTNAHGLFKADSAKVNNAMLHTNDMSFTAIRALVTGSCGYDANGLDDCSWLELMIIWVESGNHPF
jgi:hypothetical protein